MSCLGNDDDICVDATDMVCNTVITITLAPSSHSSRSLLLIMYNLL